MVGERKNEGFTLVELIVVIAIIAILAAIIAPNAFRAIEKAKTSAFSEDIKAVRAAVYNLYADTGMFPCHYEDIVCPLITGDNCPDSGNRCGAWRNVDGWNGPYLEKTPQHYWLGRASMSFQNSCIDRNKDWDNDPGCELFFCYQAPPPIPAQERIDLILDGGDGWNAGLVRSDKTVRSGSGWSTRCFWPGFADQ